MKKFLLTSCLLLFCCQSFYGQETKGITNFKEKQAVSPRLTNGIFHKKDFYELPQVNDFKCQALIITDVFGGSKIGYIKIETSSVINNKIKIEAETLSLDEIKSCSQALTYIKDVVLHSTPNNNEEFTYLITNKHISFEASFDCKKNIWGLRFNIKGINKTLDPSHINALISVMNEAKTIIEQNK